ncbi:hypothetical protein KJ570_01610 [Patescibacteria group bacterium]|nr:hypothetical protein [Patescibacteria group bacterium]MBU2036251.1 hypothetical protein [Patescibacteria group bacterium]
MPKEKIGNLGTDEKVTAQTTSWEKMEDELREEFPVNDIKKFIDPIKDWFFLRVKNNQNIEAGNESSLYFDIEDFKQKYKKCIDDSSLNEILCSVTNKLGKKLEIIKRR